MLATDRDALRGSTEIIQIPSRALLGTVEDCSISYGGDLASYERLAVSRRRRRGSLRVLVAA